MGKKIWQYPEATEIQEGDYALIDSVNEGSRKIPVSLIKSKLISKTVTERGTYKASDDEVNGYSEVNVEVPFTNIHVKSGDIVTFDDGEDLPLASLKVGIEPIQSGSGDPSPSNVRPISGWTEAEVSVTGKNIFDKNTVNYETGFITSTGEISTSINGYQHTSFIKVNPNTDYVFSGDIIGSNLVNAVAFYDSKKEFISRFAPSANTPASFTTPSSCKYIRTNVYADKDADTIQLEQGTTATAYEAFGTTTTIPFTDGDNPLTVYGGSLDVTSGELVVDWAMLDLGNLNYTKNATFPNIFNTTLAINAKTTLDAICEIYTLYGSEILSQYDYGFAISAGLSVMYIKNKDYAEIDDFKTAMNGVKVVYKLANPITYQLTPTQVKSLLGSNNVWADTGEIEELAYQTVWNGENSDSIERLCYVEYVGRDSEEIPTISTKIDGSSFSEYLSYSSSTKKFTVLQSFNALVVPWVYQYDEASSTRARGQFFINNTKVIAVQCGSTLEGEYAGKAFAYHFSQGDTFYSYTPSSDGYPQQFLKIYNITGIPVDKLKNALDYINETT